MSFDRDLFFYATRRQTKTDFQYLYKLIIPQQLFLSSELLSLISKTQIPKPLLFLLFQKSSNSIGTEINNHKLFTVPECTILIISLLLKIQLSVTILNPLLVFTERENSSKCTSNYNSQNSAALLSKAAVNMRLTLHQFTPNDGVNLESY